MIGQPANDITAYGHLIVRRAVLRTAAGIEQDYEILYTDEEY